MWYLIGVVAIVLIGFFVYASVKNCKREVKSVDTEDKPQFRTEESLSTYEKPMNDQHSHVDFEDVE